MTDQSVSGLMQNVSKVFSATSRLIDRLVAAISIMVLYIMLALLMMQIIMRYFLGSPPSWTEETAIMLFAWLILLFASTGIKNSFHVALNTIPAHMHKLRRLSDVVVYLLIASFSIVMITSGYAYVSETMSQKSAALQIPIGLLYACVPVSGAIIAFHCITVLINLAVNPPAEQPHTTPELVE